MPVCRAPYSMAVKPGQCMPSRNAALTVSTCTAFDASLASHGRIEYPTKTFLCMRASQACLQCSLRDTCTGSATCSSRKIDRLLKDALYFMLLSASRPVGLPMLCFKDVCKRDMKSAKINPDSWTRGPRMVCPGVRRAVAQQN